METPRGANRNCQLAMFNEECLENQSLKMTVHFFAH